MRDPVKIENAAGHKRSRAQKEQGAKGASIV